MQTSYQIVVNVEIDASNGNQLVTFQVQNDDGTPAVLPAIIVVGALDMAKNLVYRQIDFVEPLPKP